ncbi:amino acid ABC transporter permease [Janibacter alkaliphilus]|uniref:Glutamate transport system permease protein n=1 Tax=Janibacter alkaliphilus TaxID=1069963 RepID=A0A852X423_9MICO|nr:amino acid ABC transporter permease [Janibacter alkaliphilus]NYG36090.1 glutamate transport system permease protein [Janibacter alkaliphilus]
MSSSVLFDAPGPRARRRHRLLTVLAALVLLGLVYLALGRLGERGELEPEKWQAMFTRSAWENYFLPGIWATLRAAGIAIVLALVFGFVFGMGRVSQNRYVRWVSGVVVEFFRGIPVLIMMIAFFYFLAYQGIFAPTTNPFVAVIAALTLYNGSVIAELVRSGVGSLPAGQAEAGLSVGLTPGQTMRSIQLPQAITAMLPALVGQLVVVLKDSALGAIITYPELLRQARNLAAGGDTLQPLVIAAVIFIVINFSLTTFAGWLESRINRRGHTAGGAQAAVQDRGAAT